MMVLKMVYTLSKNVIFNAVLESEAIVGLLPPKIDKSLFFTLYLSPIDSITKNPPDKIAVVPSSYIVS